MTEFKRAKHNPLFAEKHFDKPTLDSVSILKPHAIVVLFKAGCINQEEATALLSLYFVEIMQFGLDESFDTSAIIMNCCKSLMGEKRRA